MHSDSIFTHVRFSKCNFILNSQFLFSIIVNSNLNIYQCFLSENYLTYGNINIISTNIFSFNYLLNHFETQFCKVLYPIKDFKSQKINIKKIKIILLFNFYNLNI